MRKEYIREKEIRSGRINSKSNDKRRRHWKRERFERTKRREQQPVVVCSCQCYSVCTCERTNHYFEETTIYTKWLL